MQVMIPECSQKGDYVGNLKQLMPQVLECFIASSIRNEAPKLYERLCEEGLVLSRHANLSVTDEDSEFVVNIRITDLEEAAEFQKLSQSIGWLVNVCDADNKNTLATSLRYIKADIDCSILRFKEQNVQQQATSG